MAIYVVSWVDLEPGQLLVATYQLGSILIGNGNPY